MRHITSVLLAVFLAVPAMALEVGDFAPCVVLEDIQPNGKSIDQCIRTPKKKGEFVILEFFTPKCEDCVTNLEPLDRLAADTSATATTRLIGVERKKENVLAFLEEHDNHINVPVSLDLQSNAAKAYGVVAVPTLFVLNNKNRVVFKHLGPLSEETVAAIKNVVK